MARGRRPGPGSRLPTSFESGMPRPAMPQAGYMLFVVSLGERATGEDDAATLCN